MIRRSRPLFLVVVALVISGCEGWAATRSEPRPDSVIVESERIDAPEGTRAWRLEYRSTTVGGEPTVVTGWVAIPEVEGTMPIIAWGHPTAGLGDDCAPSLGSGRTPFDFQPELDAGWVMVATDYEGLGGPGVHPYLVSESEARSIFDIARAARELDARVGDRLLLWGFSQGGHAALSAAAMGPDLAPEFELLGTVAVAPAVDLIGWPPEALGTPQQGYIAAIVAGFSAGYGLDPATVLTDEAVELLDEIETSCIDPTLNSVARLPVERVFRADPSTVDPWRAHLLENSPEFSRIDSPVLLVVGDSDSLWPAELLPVIVNRMCAAGTPVETAIMIGASHASVSGAARGTIHEYLARRLAGEPIQSEC